MCSPVKGEGVHIYIHHSGKKKKEPRKQLRKLFYHSKYL